MCGEKFPGLYRLGKEMGSPPRVRGKVRTVSLEDIKQRITPACAGKRAVRKVTSIVIKDHPRVCGEKFTFL